MVICQNCGKDTPEGKFCEYCGGSIQAAQTYQQPPPATTKAQVKNPVLALIASFIICGVGQMYNGQILKGVILLVVMIIIYALAGLVALIVTLYAMYDAYTTAVKINNGEVVETWTTRA